MIKSPRGTHQAQRGAKSGEQENRICGPLCSVSDRAARIIARGPRARAGPGPGPGPGQACRRSRVPACLGARARGGLPGEARDGDDCTTHTPGVRGAHALQKVF